MCVCNSRQSDELPMLLWKPHPSELPSKGTMNSCIRAGPIWNETFCCMNYVRRTAFPPKSSDRQLIFSPLSFDELSWIFYCPCLWCQCRETLRPLTSRHALQFHNHAPHAAAMALASVSFPCWRPYLSRFRQKLWFMVGGPYDEQRARPKLS